MVCSKSNSKHNTVKNLPNGSLNSSILTSLRLYPSSANSSTAVRLSFHIVWISCHSGFHRVSRPETLEPFLTSPLVDVDITKPNTGFMSVSRPHSTRSPSERPSSGVHTPDAFDAEGATYAEPLSEGEGDEDMDVAPARDEGARIGLSDGQAADAIAYREKHLKERAQQPGPSRARSSECLPVVPAPPTTPAPRPPRLRTLSIDPLVPSSTFDERFKDRLREVKRAHDEDEVHIAQTGPTGNEDGDDRMLTREWHAPSGKRIVVPVRIEPKVYFATERTFLVRVHHLILVSFF